MRGNGNNGGEENSSCDGGGGGNGSSDGCSCRSMCYEKIALQLDGKGSIHRHTAHPQSKSLQQHMTLCFSAAASPITASQQHTLYSTSYRVCTRADGAVSDMHAGEWSRDCTRQAKLPVTFAARLCRAQDAQRLGCTVQQQMATEPSGGSRRASADDRLNGRGRAAAVATAMAAAMALAVVTAVAMAVAASMSALILKVAAMVMTMTKMVGMAVMVTMIS